MVFEYLEIWRGVIIQKKFIQEYLEYSNDIYKQFVDEYGEKIALYTLIDYFNDIVHDDNEYNIDKEMYNIFQLSPCCSKNEDILLGFKLKSYKRLMINNKNAHCSKLLDPTDTDYKRKCGDLTVCNDCFNKTTNGSYKITEIFNKTTECTSWCFICNKDRCNIVHKNDKYEVTLTTKELIDSMLKTLIDSIDLESYEIKNYYRIDDCIWCS